MNSGQWSEKERPFDFAQGRLQDQANEGPRERFWIALRSWNHFAPKRCNDRQTCGMFWRRVFSRLRGKWAGRGLRGRRRWVGRGSFLATWAFLRTDPDMRSRARAYRWDKLRRAFTRTAENNAPGAAHQRQQRRRVLRSVELFRPHLLPPPMGRRVAVDSEHY